MSQTMAPFRVSAAAMKRIAEITASESKGAALRVEVLAGGCKGFQYRFDLTRDIEENDLVTGSDDALVVIDPSSLELLAGAELDYKDTLMGSYFEVQNPNANSSCGCGTSFSVD